VQDSKNFAEERYDRIMEILMQETSVEVSALAKLLNVTDATIRRDLKYLESKEKLYRTHGGAIYREEPIFWQTTSIENRAKEHPAEKKRIARYVASIVSDKDSLMIDGGSTNTVIAEELAKVRKHLMVVTNSQHIGEIIMNSAGENQAIIIGGELMYQTQNTVGPIAVNMINDFRLDTAIISATSVMPDQGCFSANPQEGEIKKQMMINANKVYIVVDSSKIGKYALYLFSDFKDIDAVITDAGIRKRDLETFRRKQIDVRLAR
jgi:DeoR/GlpR family transcriptional regulator of sugar metabolism